MQSRFGKKEFSFFPQSFILPQDAKLLRKAWESSSRQKWIVKPVSGSQCIAGCGLRVGAAQDWARADLISFPLDF